MEITYFSGPGEFPLSFLHKSNDSFFAANYMVERK